MAYQFFNPSQMNNVAKFQGSMAGVQAGNAPYIGVAQGPTSIYNQAGYYALQDTNSGYVHLAKLANDSMYTNNWYDQSMNTTFDFRGQGHVFDASKLSNNMTAEEIAKLAN